MTHTQNLDFYLCKDCRTLSIYSEFGSHTCDNCGGRNFRKMEGNFIIHCPVCYEYWPKHVLRLISEEAILECPSKACHGLLKIRKDLTDQEVEQELPEEKGKKENEENLISGQKETPQEKHLSESKAEGEPSVDAGGGSVSDLKEDDSLEPPEIVPPKLNTTSKEEVEEKKLKDEKKSTEEKMEREKGENKQEIEPPKPTSVSKKSSEEINPAEKSGKGKEKHIKTPHKQDQTTEKPKKSKKTAPESRKTLKTLSSDAIPMVKAVEKPDISLFLDIKKLSRTHDEESSLTLLNKLRQKNAEEIKVELQSYKQVIVDVLLDLYDKSNFYIEEPIQNTFYVGDLRGDLKRMLNLLDFFIPLIEMYPSIKIIFLGNYFSQKSNDLEAFYLLSLFYLSFPENVVILRGKRDFEEFFNTTGVYRRIKNKISSETQKSEDVYRFLANVLKKLPLFHIGSMNQGQIRVYSSNHSIPVDIENNKAPVEISFLTKDHIKQDFARIDLDKYSNSIFSTDVNLNMLLSFFKKNKLHYFVRSSEAVKDGIKFDYNDLCCTIYSTGEDPKFIRLAPGQTPSILKIESGMLRKQLKEEYGIQLEE